GFRANTFTRGHNQLAPEPLPLPRIPVLRRVVRWVNRDKRRLWKYKSERRAVRQSQLVFEKIQRGGSDWLSDFI
ncbi:MAG TPA: hypothetical protein VJ996_05610, partial [Solirubrobacteraceae bacterium]|nr:hypothetical protein [Solirubrobacteraceae bacterium]